MSASVSFVIFVLVTTIILGNTLKCDDPVDLTTGICGQLSKDLNRALVKDEGNLFRIRRAFFHSPTASPVLLKVVYNITYAVSEGILPCFSQHLQDSTIELNQTSITVGWTSSGVYTMFHPTVLSLMQVQSPFTFLRIIHRTLPEQRSPEAETFLWDGSYDLPTVHVNLHISSLTCLPSQEVFISVLKDLNTMLKLYGGQDQVLSIMENVEFIGFTLPATSVTSNVIPIGSDVIFVNLYSSILCILYAISICLLTVWYFSPSSPAKKLIDRVINDKPDLSLGIRITSTTGLIIEFIARLATCITWTLNTQNSAGIVFGIWMPQIHLLLMAAVQIVFVSSYVSYQKKMEEKKKDGIKENELGENTDKGEQEKRKCCDCNTKSELRTFSNMSATAFALFYMLFPTIILMFAYPTQIIVIFTFVTAYLFATTIFSASIIKLYNFLKHKGDDNKNNVQNCKEKKNQESSLLAKLLKMAFVVLLFITLWVIVVYLHALVVFVSYSLLIGRGSVINTGPLFLISLLPSAILSGGAWVAKRIALNDPKSKDEDLESQDKKEKSKSGHTDVPLGNGEQTALHTLSTARNRYNGNYHASQHSLEDSV